MKYNLLGNSELKISAISLGCMSFGLEHNPNAEILHYAFDHGVNFFDTSDLYDKGFNEITVGKALKGIRQQVLLATKVGNQWREDGSGWDWNPRKDYMLKAVEASLRRFGTDYIDLYQLHGGTIDDPIDEIIEAFEILKQEGKIRYYGISSIRPNVIREYINRANIVSVMTQYSLLDRRPEKSCLDLLKQHNIGVLTRGTLARGLLINKPASSYLNYNTKEVRQAAQAIAELSNEQRNLTNTAMGFVLGHPAISAAMLGCRTMAHIKEGLGITDFSPLTEKEIMKLKNVLPVNNYDKHR